MKDLLCDMKELNMELMAIRTWFPNESQGNVILLRVISKIAALINVYDSPFYTELWSDRDLENALVDENIEITPQNMEKMRRLVKEAFSDLSERNESIRSIARENLGKE